MPTQRLSMRRIREVLRLRHQGLTERIIARMIGVSNGVAHGYLRRARLAGLTWPLPEGMDDEGLELLLFPAPTSASQSDRRPAPDWIYVEQELRRRSVTRLLLWEEYRATNPDGFGYTWFCTTFDAWKKRARPTMRQTHMGGEKVFVDFAGDTIDIFDPITGQAHAMKLFVAATAAMAECSKTSAAFNSSSLMTGASRYSIRPNGATFWRFSTIATVGLLPSSPVRSPSNIGTTS